MQRREFITLLGGGAAATAITWPRSARPQDGARRIAVIIGSSESDPSVLPRVAAFRQGLNDLGWIEGRNLRIPRPFAHRGLTSRAQKQRVVEHKLTCR
jgi:putative ABC transport system substrate-binding protein